MSKLNVRTVFLLLPLFLLLISCESQSENYYLLNEKSSEEVEQIEPHIPTFESGSFNDDGQDAKQKVWDLVFFDEFTSGKLDKKKWEALDRKKNYNNELQEYTTKNIVIEDERLLLIAKDSGQKYTSGLVQTKGKFEFLYGKVEIKGRYPIGKGLFPAIWMLPADESDHLPEIDILESVGHEPHLIYQVLHWREDGKNKRVFNMEEIGDLDEDHIYGIEWDEEEVRWYLDHRLIFTAKNNIPDMPMYLIINLAVGGNWPGNPDQSTTFPALFSIDYVKIYTKVGK